MRKLLVLVTVAAMVVFAAVEINTDSVDHVAHEVGPGPTYVIVNWM